MGAISEAETACH